MRKKWFHKGMSLCLAAAMALGLTACGGADKVSADPSLAKQYVYSCQDIEIPQMGDSFDIQRGYFSDGKIYLLANVYQWNENGNSQELRLISLNEDGTNLQEIELQTSAAGSGAAGQEGEAQEETPDEEAEQSRERSYLQGFEVGADIGAVRIGEDIGVVFKVQDDLHRTFFKGHQRRIRRNRNRRDREADLKDDEERHQEK